MKNHGWIRHNSYMHQDGTRSIYHAKAKLRPIEAAEIAVADGSVVSGMVREAMRLPENERPEVFPKTDRQSVYFRFPGIALKSSGDAKNPGEAEKFEELTPEDRSRVLRGAAVRLLEYQRDGIFILDASPYPGTRISNVRTSAGPNLWVARAAWRKQDGSVRVGRSVRRGAGKQLEPATQPYYAVARDFEGRENETRNLYEITNDDGHLQYLLFADSIYCAVKMVIAERGERITPAAIDPTFVER